MTDKGGARSRKASSGGLKVSGVTSRVVRNARGALVRVDSKKVVTGRYSSGATPTAAKVRGSSSGGAKVVFRRADSGVVQKKRGDAVSSYVDHSRDRGQVLIEVVGRMLEAVSAVSRDTFLASVGRPDQHLDPDLWGSGPSAEERDTAFLESLRREYSSRQSLIEQSLTTYEAAELLGISDQAVLDRIDSGRLIGLRQGRAWRLPRWQFDPDAERGFVPGLAELQKVFPGGPVTLSSWVTTANVDLAGTTPEAELVAGNADRVLALASSLTAAAW